MLEDSCFFKIISSQEESFAFMETHENDEQMVEQLYLDDLPYEFENILQHILSEETLANIYHQELVITTIKTANFKSIITLDTYSKKIFVANFFFSTLTNENYIEFKLYLYILLCHLHHEISDILIDIRTYLANFIQERKKELSGEELNVLGISNEINALALTFINLTRSQLKTLSHLERKVLKELLSNSKIRKLLNLESDAFDYLKNGNLNDETLKNQSQQFESYVKSNEVEISTYVNEHLSNKRILLWFWWTVSPFLTKDTSRLLDIISQELKMKRIYIDLPMESQSFFDDYIDGKISDDNKLEDHIKNIYPPFFDPYQKESTLYISLIKKLRNLSQRFYCIGYPGIELLQMQPFINRDSMLEFPTETRWLDHLDNELSNFHTIQKGELVLFIQFLKPMLKMPPSVITDPHVETLIHVDQYTGFSPQSPHNSLAAYSYYNSSRTSFMVPNIENAYFKREKIVYIPEDSIDQYPIDHRKFNQFELYKSLFYTHHSNGGGGGSRKDIFNPQTTEHLH